MTENKSNLYGSNSVVGYVSPGSLDMNYEKLKNKPSINGVELDGNKTSEELGIEFKNGLPSGGKLGQVLVKNGEEDFESEWQDINTEEEDPTVPKYVKEITKENIESWNNKSDFSGKYEDLQDKPEIPTKLSDLKNDEEFITKAVDDLENYYLKEKSYTKEEVNELIGNLHSVSISKVDTLPEVGESNVIYLVPNDETEENNVYDEYIFVDGSPEKIGSTKIDLSDYALKEEIPTKVSELENDSGFITLDDMPSNDVIGNEEFEIIYWDGKSSDSNPSNIDLFNDIIEKTKTKTVYVFSQSAPGQDYSSLPVFPLKLGYFNNKTSGNQSFKGIPRVHPNSNVYAIGSRIEFVYDAFTINLVDGEVNTVRALYMTTSSSYAYLPTDGSFPSNYKITSVYQPANVKYVNDYVDEQLGDLSTILATLTTVNETAPTMFKAPKKSVKVTGTDTYIEPEEVDG